MKWSQMNGQQRGWLVFGTILSISWCSASINENGPGAKAADRMMDGGGGGSVVAVDGASGSTYHPRPARTDRPAHPQRTSTGIKQYTTRPDYIGAYKRSDFERFMSYLAAGDHAAADQMVRMRQVFYIPEGEQVFVESNNLVGTVQLRYAGTQTTFWTVREAIE